MALLGQGDYHPPKFWEEKKYIYNEYRLILEIWPNKNLRTSIGSDHILSPIYSLKLECIRDKLDILCK